MPKYYVIPVDVNDNGYFGVKSRLSPYNGAAYWGGLAPNVFGGNAQGTVRETLYQETREESHHKVDINSDALNLGGANANWQQVHASGNMTFYAIRGNFVFHVNPFFPQLLANMNKYRETTGEVIVANLRHVNTAHRTTAGGDIMRAYQTQFGPRIITALASSQFLGSEMAEAIRQTAIAVQAGTL